MDKVWIVFSFHATDETFGKFSATLKEQEHYIFFIFFSPKITLHLPERGREIGAIERASVCLRPEYSALACVPGRKRVYESEKKAGVMASWPNENVGESGRFCRRSCSL